MDNKLRRTLALLLVAVVALALTLLLSSGDQARAMLQTSPLDSPIGQPPATQLPDPGVEPPTPGVATLAAPTSVPLPELVGPTPTARGFLPAPTIVNPNDLDSLPLARPPVSGAGESAEPTPAPAPAPRGNATVRAAVALINYLWLLCGGMLLVGGAVAIILLWRRGRQT